MNPVRTRQPSTLPFAPRETALRFRAGRSEASLTIGGPAPRTPAEWLQAAEERPVDPERRAALLRELGPHWGRLDLPEAARRSRERLEDPATRIVVAGQQPALWGGPLMLAVKALAAIRTARRLEEAGIPAVPIFWVASEDHDVDELWGGLVPHGSSGGIELVPPFPRGRRMLGTLRFEQPMEARIAAVAPLLEGAPAEVEPLYRNSLADGPAEEFVRLLLGLFGGDGLLPVRPEWLRTLSRPLILAELEAPGRLAAQVREQIEALVAHDLPVPIPEPADLPFFWIDEGGARHRVRIEGEGKVRIGGPSGGERSIPELRDEIEANPERVSPDALLRPWIQDSLLQPVATLLGPTELAYQWELGEVYRSRGVPRPVLLPRPRVRVIDEEDAERLEANGISIDSLVPGIRAVDRIPSPRAARLAGELDDLAQPLIERIVAWAEDPENDPALRKRTDRLARRLREDMEKLAAVLPERAAPDVAEARREVGEILERVFPGGREGERSLALLGFLARHGRAGLAAIADVLEPGDGAIVTVVLGSERSGGTRE